MIQNIVNKPQNICIKGNISEYVCMNQNCHENPFICMQKNQKQECYCYQKLHKSCPRYVQWQYLKTQIANKITKKQNQLNRYEQYIKELLDDIRKVFVEIEEKFNNEKLNAIETTFMEIIKQNKLNKLSGNLLKTVFQESLKIDNLIIRDQKLLDMKTKSIKKTLDGLRQQFNQFFTQNLHFDSKITNDFTTLRSFFNKKLKNIRLLYRASQNNFSSHLFHLKCDNIPHTVTILQTEFGKIIGGYTPLTWKSNMISYEADNQKQSFVFSLTLKQKMPLIISKYAIQNHKASYGPKFGNDIYIADKSNQNLRSYSNFPHSYSNGEYENIQQTYTKFCGQKNGYYFKVKEWEVFQFEFE